MKKALTLLNVVAILAMVLFITAPRKVEAADVYLIPITDDSSNCWITARDAPYRIILFDTLTFHAKNGDSLLDLGAMYYNFSIRSLNAADESASVKIAFGAHKGHWHLDSVSRNIAWSAVGLDSGDDYFFAPIGAQYIYVRNVVDGPSGAATRDSTTCLEIKAYR